MGGDGFEDTGEVAERVFDVADIEARSDANATIGASSLDLRLVCLPDEFEDRPRDGIDTPRREFNGIRRDLGRIAAEACAN
jgi:hypothetical protein